jgi:hypothetical protein
VHAGHTHPFVGNEAMEAFVGNEAMEREFIDYKTSILRPLRGLLVH